MSDNAALLESFRETLNECRQLYVSAARTCSEQHPDLVHHEPREFVALMDDLHKGLLIKIYVTIAQADRRWSRAEQQMASVLFEHICGTPLNGEPLRAAILHVVQQASQLRWYALVRPFEDLAPLRDRVAELETLVMRLANLVAKADGTLHEAERARLHDIQGEMQRHLRRVPLDEPGQHEVASEVGHRAVQEIRHDAKQVREQCELTPSPEAQEGSQEDALRVALDDLDALVGLAEVKQEVRTLINYLRVQEERQRLDLPTGVMSLHMVFRGNPGTGKTTVARIVGRVFGALGILQQGHLVETDRSGLVAEYAGQTGPKTNRKIDEALDGMLFIDEAYSLVSGQREDPYGQEAVQALLKRMEDDRQRLVVVLAGYSEPMDQLLRSNPGLSSRFNRTFTFDDYTTIELAQVFEGMCERNHYELRAMARARLLLGFQWRVARRDEHFGNGRMVRNVFESATRHLANRIVDLVPLTKELLTTIEAEDIVMEDVPDDVWSLLEQPDWRLRVTCPGCSRPRELRAEHLGERMRCRSCGEQFVASWGEPPAC